MLGETFLLVLSALIVWLSEPMETYLHVSSVLADWFSEPGETCMCWVHSQTNSQNSGDLLACVGKDHDGALLIGLCIFVQDVHKVSILDICRHQDIVLLQTLNGGNPAEYTHFCIQSKAKPRYMQSKLYIYHKQDHLIPHFIRASSHTKDFTPFNLHIHNNVFKTLQYMYFSF